MPAAGTIRIPSVPGYVALKLAAWLDRSAWGQYKDAGDLAAVLHWYANSNKVSDRLYSDETGHDILLNHHVDPELGAAHLLGLDVAGLIGAHRHAELKERWPGGRGPLLPAEMNLTTRHWPRDLPRRLELLNAFESGLDLPHTRI